MSTRARATSMRAIRHGARKLTARARAVRALLSTGTKGRIPAHYTDAGWFRDRSRTQPWVYPFDLEQQVQWVDDLTGQPRGWALGPDRITNGDFSVDANWIKGTGWSISGGAAVANAATGNLSQNNVAPNPAGKIYRVSLTIVSRSAGSIVPQISGSSVTLSSPGTYSFYLSPTSGTDATLYIPAVNFTGTIDNVTVQEVILDQSWLGPELVTNGDFSNGTTGWLALNGSRAVVNGEIVITANGTAYPSAFQQLNGLVINRSYILEGTARKGSGAATVGIQINGVGGVYTSSTTDARLRLPFVATATSLEVAAAINGSTVNGDQAFFDNISVREIPGHPSVSPSAGNGPTATARVNLFSWTEDLTRSIWTKSDVTTPTATRIQETATSNHHIVRNVSALTSGLQYVLRVRASAAERSWIVAGCNVASGAGNQRCAFFNLSNGTVGTIDNGNGSGTTASIVAVGGGVYDCIVRFTATSTQADFGPASADNTRSYAGDGTSGINVFRSDVRLAVYDSLNVPAYQRVGDGSAGVFDYDHVGFPVRLVRGAANRGLMTLGTLDLTGTDAVNAGMWVLKTSDASGFPVVLETSANADSTNGAVVLMAPRSAGTASYSFSSRGTSQRNAIHASGYAAPHISALHGISKISTPRVELLVNGVSAVDTGSQGTGNYGNHRLYEGGRSLDSSPSLSFTGEWLPGFVCDANGVPADLAAEVLREYAAAVNFYY